MINQDEPCDGDSQGRFRENLRVKLPLGDSTSKKNKFKKMGKIGKIFWQDLTVENAEQVKDFYCSVVGWTFENVNQGEYNDFNIINPNDNNEIVAGICHKKGEIKSFPSQWLNYVVVENIEISIEKCKSLGGKIIDGPKPMGKSKFVIIQDPAGAYLALMEN